MRNRREFLKKTALAGAGLSISLGSSLSCQNSKMYNKPLVLSTWNAGMEANDVAIEILKNGGSALDAVEKGVMVCERDPTNHSVGFGGAPDREGHVTLDAAIMDHLGNAGSVTFLEDIMHPIAVARKVMEETPHVLLSGDGARQFAINQGFEVQNLLTEESKKQYEKWLEKSEYSPIINVENHDTIGMLSMDQKGDLSGACTTSGLAYKMRGRVGDSPIIGAGLFVDNEIGAATATGLGEMILKTVGSFLIVELMRSGMSPQAACEEAVGRICRKMDYKDFQVAYVAMNKKGEIGAYSIHPGFNYALHDANSSALIRSDSFSKG